MKLDKYTFKSKDFYGLLEKQKFKCPLTGRDLTPETTTAEHILPLKKGGQHALENIYLIDEMASKLKRQYAEEEIVHFAADILKTIGAEYGFKVTKTTTVSRLVRTTRSKKS
ncbi:MAG TPA: HNH endonuclease signature motif containing protein [Leptospiraceae bacterium]|nr:HNH endonuclease [Leptospirales bacterium]HMU84599.1 HNH endonuclease signature motif containing protein [Leptospiraceae bacterium]HMY45807.1 HNH endonuclease signature motif containing protein [Leptospiraceae bacterium]HNL01769.1 HNH endonuclease signature motif containing protein [Leptospiraceae bacterium]HNN60369.1 HNH endonuclease signature motif containing protein [Leptospiraceae bacterium]